MLCINWYLLCDLLNLKQKIPLYVSLFIQFCCFVFDLPFFLRLLSSLRAQNQIDLFALLLYTLWYLSCNLLNLIQKVHLNIALSKKQSCCFVMDLTFFLKLFSSLQAQNQIDLLALPLCGT